MLAHGRPPVAQADQGCTPPIVRQFVHVRDPPLVRAGHAGRGASPRPGAGRRGCRPGTPGGEGRGPGIKHHHDGAVSHPTHTLDAPHTCSSCTAACRACIWASRSLMRGPSSPGLETCSEGRADHNIPLLFDLWYTDQFPTPARRTLAPVDKVWRCSWAMMRSSRDTRSWFGEDTCIGDEDDMLMEISPRWVRPKSVKEFYTRRTHDLNSHPSTSRALAPTSLDVAFVSWPTCAEYRSLS